MPGVLVPFCACWLCCDCAAVDGAGVPGPMVMNMPNEPRMRFASMSYCRKNA